MKDDKIPINRNNPKDFTGIKLLNAKVPNDNIVVIIDKNTAKNVISLSAALFEKNIA